MTLITYYVIKTRIIQPLFALLIPHFALFTTCYGGERKSKSLYTRSLPSVL
jgi:hypothetical protein